jgi:lipopolysaccharide export system protein LptA
MSLFRALKNSKGWVALVLLLVICGSPALAQKKVKLKQADKAKGGRKNGDRYERLLGNVIFIQNKTTIYCDSAHFFKKKNSLEAFGKVRITEGDSVTITGRKLEYDGDKKLAKLRNNVVFTKLATATLYTDHLDYMRPSNMAFYYNGGKLVDSANVLTSRKGYYDLNSNMASFKKDVKVVNPDYTMFADSLQYNTRSKLIYFVAKTTVVNKDSSTFEYERGVYNTATKVSDLKSGTGETQDYTIVGNEYDLDALRNIAKVRGDVVMTYKKEQLIIYGQASDYYKSSGLTKVYNNAYVAKVTDQDTLFMTADTLVSLDDIDPTKRRLLAFHNVKIYNKDLQGTADSLEYRSSDSTIYFYKDPILWSEGNQLTADSIRMLIKNNTINKIYLVANAFVISQDTLTNFNQIKGRKMTADIANSRISRVYVQGNGESLYYAVDEKLNVLMGMNKIICSNIIIRFREGRVNNLSFLVKPEANFIPPHELKKDEMVLKGFEWKSEKKPTRNDVVKSKKTRKPQIQAN